MVVASCAFSASSRGDDECLQDSEALRLVFAERDIGEHFRLPVGVFPVVDPQIGQVFPATGRWYSLLGRVQTDLRCSSLARGEVRESRPYPMHPFLGFSQVQLGWEVVSLLSG